MIPLLVHGRTAVQEISLFTGHLFVTTYIHPRLHKSFPRPIPLFVGTLGRVVLVPLLIFTDNKGVFLFWKGAIEGEIIYSCRILHFDERKMGDKKKVVKSIHVWEIIYYGLAKRRDKKRKGKEYGSINP